MDMKKYISILILTFIVSISSLLTSCGNDAGMNNGNDTGVSGKNGGVAGDVSRAVDDSMRDFGNENVDEYQENSIDNWGNDNSRNKDVTNNADMSYDANGIMNGTSLNY